MRMSHASYFGRLVGESPRSGLTFPDIVAVARAYGLAASRAQGQCFDQTLMDVLNGPGPALCEVLLDPEQQFEPRVSSRQLPDGRMVSAALEDLHPFLSREELRDNLLIPPAGEV
jgi:acetolactate synthase I/II/III large subunit